MNQRLIRVTRRVFEKHFFEHGDVEAEPLYFIYDEDAGLIEIWPRDRARKYELTITVKEK